jgi:hypothetical protein
MKTIESFLESATKPPEDHMVNAYRKATNEMDVEQAKLMRYLRVKDGKAVFLDGVSDVQDDVAQADETVQYIRADICEYLDCLGDEYGSVTAMSEKLARLKRSLANVEHDVKAVAQRELTGNKKDITVDAESLRDKRDRMRTELQPQIEDLSRRISKARELLDRYKA